MTKVVYSPVAMDDLVGIKDYIQQDLLNPDASERVILRITKSIRRLETTPLIGEPLSTMIDIDTDYRFLVSGNYFSFYRYRDNTCFVDRIFYGKRDFAAILFSDVMTLDEE